VVGADPDLDLGEFTDCDGVGAEGFTVKPNGNTFGSKHRGQNVRFCRIADSNERFEGFARLARLLNVVGRTVMSHGPILSHEGSLRDEVREEGTLSG